MAATEPLPARALYRLGHGHWRHPSSLTGLAFADQGRILVTACSRRVRAWDPTDGELRFERSDGARRMAVAPDGNLVALADYRGATIVDALTGEQVVECDPEAEGLNVLVFSPCGRWLYGADGTGHLLSWQSADGSLQARTRLLRERIGELTVSADGTYLACLDAEQRISLADPRNMSRLSWLHESTAESFAVIRFAPRDALLAMGTFGGVVWLVDVERSKTVAQLDQSSSGIHALCFGPGGNTLLTGGSDATVRLWDLSTGHIAATMDTGGVPIGQLAVSPSGDLLIAATASSIRRFALTDRRPLPDPSPTAPIDVVACSPDGRTFATAFARNLWLWDAPRRQVMRRFDRRAGDVTSLSWSPDGTCLAQGGWSDGVRVIDLRTGEVSTELELGSGAAVALAFSPDGALLTAGTSGGKIFCWQLGSGRQLLAERGHGRWADCVVWSRDSKVLCSGGADGRLRLWQPASGRQLDSVRADEKRVRALAISPDGRVLASGGNAPEVRLWRLSTAGQPTLEQQGEIATGRPSGVRALAFVGGGALLAQQDWGNTITIWDVQTREPVLTLDPTGNAVASMAALQGANQLVTGLGDGSTLVWDLRTDVEERCQELRAMLEAGCRPDVHAAGPYRQTARESVQPYRVRSDRSGRALELETASCHVRLELGLRRDGYWILIAARQPRAERASSWLAQTGLWLEQALSPVARLDARRRRTRWHRFAERCGSRLDGLVAALDAERATRTVLWHLDSLPPANLLAEVVEQARGQVIDAGETGNGAPRATRP